MDFVNPVSINRKSFQDPNPYLRHIVPIAFAHNHVAASFNRLESLHTIISPCIKP